jgi:TM2 domain-containing membrane protein YozV
MRHDEILGLLHLLLARGQEATLSWAASWELAFWALVLMLAALLALLRPRWIDEAENSFRRVSQHRGACAWSVGASVLVIRTLLLPLIPIPVPVFLDEYSYLLGADTFAAGRLTNPPHPMWIHFETFNVNMQPTYQSMYPPAQGLLLGLAQKLTGEPWIGVLLSVAVMCGVFTWMLQGWMPPQWALLGGLYSVVRYGIFSYWINSYWGGAVAAIGGALLLGSFARLRRRLSWQQSLLFAAGLVLLANSRPFEGLLFALPLLGALAWRVFRSAADRSADRTADRITPRHRALAEVLMPCLLLLGVAAAAMLYYNWRGTGRPLLMPYTLNQNAYHVSRPFLFQKPYPIPHYRNPQMRTFYMFHEYPDLLRSRTAWGLQILMEQKFFCYYVFLVWPLLLLFIPGLILAAASAELRVVLCSIALLMLGLTAQIWPAHGHYAAPAAGAVLLIQLHALYRLRTGGPFKPAVGLSGAVMEAAPNQPYSAARVWFSRSIVVSLFLAMLLPIADRLWNPNAFDFPRATDMMIPRQIDRERILSQLNRTPGEHLVLVHYQQRDVPSVEWVYNRADIDQAKVVWARDMGPEANQELLRYFRNRQVWYVDRNSGALLEPYTYTTQTSHADPPISCHPANGLPPACEVITELGLPQPALP